MAFELAGKKAKEALKCYRQAAEGGNGDAQFRLGKAHEFGGELTLAIDLEAARTWYQKAAEGGDLDAQCRLGFATCTAPYRGKS